MEANAGHRKRRLEQFRQHGLDTLTAYEALELLLFYAIPRQDVKPLARQLISLFGGLNGVLSASVEDLRAVPGVGEYTATLLTLVPQLCRMALVSDDQDQVLNTTDALGAHFLTILGTMRDEVSYQVCMDAKGRRLSCRLLSRGNPFSTGVSVRETVSNALQCGAVMVALGHNHPSGVAFPSDDDLTATAQVRDALAAVDIYLVDHIIVADRDYISLRLSGFL